MLMLPLSRNQLDRAGGRIRAAARERRPHDPAVLEVIDGFRALHLPTLEEAQRRLSMFLHDEAGLPEERYPVTSRLKTSGAIIAKLTRTATSLTRMQDVAGARGVVPSLESQDVVGINVKDQRQNPDRYGYRAVHVIVRLHDRIAEVQVRSDWQDRWAQVVEGLDSRFRSDLKHGRGPAEWLEWLHELSDELRKADLGEPYAIPAGPDMPDELE